MQSVGVTISDDHVENISKRASIMLNFLQRNLKYCLKS